MRATSKDNIHGEKRCLDAPSAKRYGRGQSAVETSCLQSTLDHCQPASWTCLLRYFQTQTALWWSDVQAVRLQLSATQPPKVLPLSPRAEVTDSIPWHAPPLRIHRISREYLKKTTARNADVGATCRQPTKPTPQPRSPPRVEHRSTTHLATSCTSAMQPSDAGLRCPRDCAAIDA